MSFAKKTIGQDEIAEDKLKSFLTGAKDEQTREVAVKASDTHVNDKRIPKESVTNLIGKGATFETNFTRQTYYVHNDIIKRLDKLTKKAPRGEKTKIINAALEQYLNSL